MKNNMKNTTLFLILAVVVALAVPIGAQAQTATTQTVLSAAITSPNATNISVASATGISASSQTTNFACWTDGEFMRVTGVNGTNLTVTRGYQTTRATTHLTSSVVWCGTMGGSANGIGYPFTNASPVPGSGCTSTQFGNLPIMNYQTGDLSNCLTSARGGQWVTYSYRLWTAGHPIVNIPDTAYTMTLADEYVIYSNITTSRTVTLPPVTGVSGKTVTVKYNGTAGNTLTIQAPFGQFVGTGGSTSTTATNNQSKKFISIQSLAGTWGWATID